MYPETQSDFDFCLDTIKAFCASHFILKRPITDREADFETAMVDVENGCLRFQRGNANLQQYPGGLRDSDLGRQSGCSRGAKGWAGYASRRRSFQELVS